MLTLDECYQRTKGLTMEQLFRAYGDLSKRCKWDEEILGKIPRHAKRDISKYDGLAEKLFPGFFTLRHRMCSALAEHIGEKFYDKTYELHISEIARRDW